MKYDQFWWHVGAILACLASIGSMIWLIGWAVGVF